jgi:hypothetical protein
MLGALLLVQSSGMVSPALAEDSEGETVSSDQGRATTHHIEAPLLPFRLEGHGAFTWDGEFGVGGRADIPIMDDTGSSGSRDQLCISVGLDAVFVSFQGSNPRTFWPTAAVQWTLGITPEFSFFPELGLAVKIERDGFDGVLPNIGFGGRYHLYRSVALMGRLGWPMAVSLGVTL